MFGIRIAGTGSFIPPHEISNEEIVAAIGEKSADWITRFTGIENRRFGSRINIETGKPLEYINELDMAEAAARAALENANIEPGEVDGLWHVTCTVPVDKARFHRFSIELKGRLGLSERAYVVQLDAGCGGAMVAIGMARDLIRGDNKEVALIVASNATSPYVDRARYVESMSWLSPYMFGDGAGAIVLKRAGLEENSILGAVYGADPVHPLMYYRDERVQIPFEGGWPVYQIDASAVKNLYRIFMRKALEQLTQSVGPIDFAQVDRFYFHQANKRLIENFACELEVDLSKVAINVHQYGNLSAASTLVLLDEDRREGRVKEGSTALFCAVGAGIQYGSLLLIL